MVCKMNSLSWNILTAAHSDCIFQDKATELPCLQILANPHHTYPVAYSGPQTLSASLPNSPLETPRVTHGVHAFLLKKRIKHFFFTIGIFLVLCGQWILTKIIKLPDHMLSLN